MPDFYASSARMPLDQADGLRRMFAARQTRLLPLVANPHLRSTSVLLDRVAEVLANQGLQVLVVDAGAHAPPPPELVQLDLAPCIEMISPRVAYLPARQLPVQYVDTRGCAASFIDALQQAWPQADVIVLHAEVSDLARLLKHRASRPLLLAADDPESLKHAYASCKWLVQRCDLMTYDLLLAASSQSPRLSSIAASLSACADRFLGAVVRNCALVDPRVAADDAADPDLLHLLQAQMHVDIGGAFAATPGATPASSRRRTPQAWAAAPAEPFQTHTAH